MKDVQVQITYQCENCEGSGIVYDPEGWGWREVIAQTQGLDGKQWEAWLLEHKDTVPGQEPPEEGQCPNCEGTGRLAALISLDALSELQADTDSDAVAHHRDVVAQAKKANRS